MVFQTKGIRPLSLTGTCNYWMSVNGHGQQAHSNDFSFFNRTVPFTQLHVKTNLPKTNSAVGPALF